MFTGLIEEIGSVRRVVSGAEWGSIAIACKDILPGTKIGDSIAVNGVCLTVTTLQKDGFTADVMAETLRRSDLGALRQGDPVNLERAMAADGRFGGHIVAGHVDGTGTLARKKQEGNAMVLTIAATPALLYEIVEKGSITIDGISLTVAKVDSQSFAISAIPHTVAVTVLQDRKPGDKVNLETDIIGKYVEKLLQPQEVPKQSSGITRDFLSKYGF